VEVEPGHTATVPITVRNTGTVVDRYTFEALGAAAPWARFSPDSLSLFPEASGTVNLILAPPREPTVHAGPTPVGVRITSSEDPEGSVVEEGTVDVGAFSEITLELVPRVARGRIIGRTQLAVDNRSNCSYRAKVEGTDPQMALQFRFRHPVVDIAPGHAEFVKVAIRPSSRFWKGPERTRPFRLVLRDDQAEPDGVGVLVGTPPPPGIAGVEPTGDAGSMTVGRTETASPIARAPVPARPRDRAPDDAAAARGDTLASEAVPAEVAVRAKSPHKEEISAEGSLLQEPLLPRWLLAAVGALLALAVLAAILWFALFKPAVKSTAQNETNKQLAANGITPVNSSKGSKLGSGSGSGSSGSGGGGAGSSATTLPGGGGGGAGGSTVVGGTSSGAGGVGVNVNGGVTANGDGTRLVFTVPNGRTLEVTDILVENAAGATGTLTLARSGTPVMSWSMANFRDLDYHWITPTVFVARSQMQLVVNNCAGTCTPGIYYAGRLVGG
jgi:hypothetical protein